MDGLRLSFGSTSSERLLDERQIIHVVELEPERDSLGLKIGMAVESEYEESCA